MLDKTGIPTVDHVLPNGDTVVLYKFLTTGEARELQKMMLGKARMILHLERWKMSMWLLSSNIRISLQMP